MIKIIIIKSMGMGMGMMPINYMNTRSEELGIWCIDVF